MKKSILFTFIITAALALSACRQPTIMLQANSKQNEHKPVFPVHEPYGTGIGVMPGRVTWTHDPDSVEWDGEGYWWQLEHFDETVIQKMVNGGIAALAGETDFKSGWEALFRTHNNSRGVKSEYKKGQKIAIKTNINGAGAYSEDTKGMTHESYTNPVLLKALLISMVTEAGIAPGDITVYDAGRIFPDYMQELCSEGVLSGVRFLHRDLLGKNDAKADLNAPVIWSQKVSGATNYIPACVTEADYLINLANLKGHSYGITLCAKNHFGSIVNSNRMRAPEAAGIHSYLTSNKMNSYTVLVDLMANYQLGEKTMLYILDALIVAPGESMHITGKNSRWQQNPFSGDYTSSIFFSQDPVAIDSVGADLLINEPTVTELNQALRKNPNVENYLHEAGLISNAPSGTVYYNGNSEVVTNIGVHEHWNNPAQKQYSRNLGKSEGIELVYLDDFSTTKISITVGNSVFTAKLFNSEAAKALLAQFPITLDMSDLNSNEKYYNLASNLPSELAERPATIKAGDIMCWSGNCLVLFYKTFNNSYGGYVRLGYVDDVSGFAAALGSGNVKVSFAVLQ